MARLPWLTCLSFCVLSALLPSPAAAYIDMPADRRTLPRLLLEFRTSGLYRVTRFDAETGGVAYELVEAVQGNPPVVQKHVIRTGGKIPAEIKPLGVGSHAFLMGVDPYGRGLAFVGGAWYVTTFERESGWWRIAYTSAHFDFRCAYAGDDVRALVAACRALLEGAEVDIPCHPKAKSAQALVYRVSLREPHRRAQAAGELPRFAAPAEGRSFDDVAAALADSEPRQRGHAARALGAAEWADRAAPLLARALSSEKDALVARQCAVSLGRLGPAARGAIPALLDRFTQGYENARDLAGWEAAAAIRRIDTDGALALAEIGARLASTDSGVRRRAVEALGILGPPASDAAVQILIRSMDDAAPDVRYSAARSADQIHAPASAVSAKLAHLLADPDRDVPDAARQALLKLGAPAADAVGRMLARDQQPTTRRLAARLLHDMGPAAAARTALEQALEDPDAEVRATAVKAVERLESRR